MNWELEKENLERLINVEKVSYEEIGRKYGCSGANIKKQAKKLGIELPLRRKVNDSEHFNKGIKIKNIHTYTCLNCGKPLKGSSIKFCSNKCQVDYNYHQWIHRWKLGLESGLKGEYGISNHLKRYIFEKFDNKCCKCGWGEMNPYSQTIPLEIDHIDGDFRNNTEDNLRLLCPNCHSLTETYKGANKGQGRKDRKKYT